MDALTPLYDVAPIFISGTQRSGTTMFRLMLDAHPEISIPFETGIITNYCFKVSEFGDLDQDDNLRSLLQAIRNEPFVARGELVDISYEEITPLLKARTLAGLVDALFGANARRKGKAMWGDKTPDEDVKTLHHLFPNATIIHLIRDGRDCAVSRVRRWGARSIPELAHGWCFKVNSTRQAGRLYGDRYREIRYEDLVRSPETVLRKVCSWIGVSFDPVMLDYYKHATERMPASSVKLHHETSVKPVDPNKIGMYKDQMSRSDRLAYERVAGALLKELGYEVEADVGLLGKMQIRLAEIRYALRGQTLFRAPGT